MSEQPEQGSSPASPRKKIGLGLSGGGFRASIFHLGVIRRLEELGIMKDVNVISTVSGGSIVGAYYVCEMEKRLREHRSVLKQKPLDDVRLEVFEEIAADFFAALDHNLRSRALVFSPRYHPILFLKSLWPTCSRSDIMRREYDVFFYDGLTLDQLPSVTGEAKEAVPHHYTGPRLVINTTSLLTGERRAFSRVPISGINEINKPNRNVVLLSRVVGASAGVPGLFPPTPVFGDLLVDGGVSDNQGLDGLLEEGREYDERTDFSRADYDLLLISDASGQMEAVHRLKTKGSTVLPRTFSIFQHEIRNKMATRLFAWKRGEETEAAEKKTREFAFVHLFLNLKDRPDVKHRVPSEYITALGRIRTDLDQFSMVEREALMYHGYTLIDSQLRKHCGAFMESRGLTDKNVRPVRPTPLFPEPPSPHDEKVEGTTGSPDRTEIRAELEAGAQAIFILRSAQKHGWKARNVVVATWLIPLILLFLAYPFFSGWLEARLRGPIASWLTNTVPGWIRTIGAWLTDYLKIPITAETTTKSVSLLIQIGVLLLAGYVLAYLTYVILRRLTRRWDARMYKRQTNEDYSTHWAP